ncbi:MAG: hypothetical protein JEY91_15080, partial [Spirochaetaceae bacterium]|nr:hypothetical protein [Spirochaetaceae bacterium]
TYTGMVENEPSIQSGREHNIFSSSGIPIQKIPDNYDVVIFDRIPPPQKDDTGRFIYIDVIPSGVRTSGEKVEPRTVSVSWKHPVLESVDFSRITILKAWPSLSGSQIQEIVTGGNTGLLYVFQSRFLKFLYLPFDLTDSDLPLRASFPILMKNSIDWLTEGYSREEIIQLRSGDSIRIGRAVPEYSKTLITYPSGKKKTIEGNLFSRTFETGLYGFQYAEQMYYGSVNLNNRDESDISSRFPDVTEEDREEKTGEYKFSLMTVFLILGLLVLVAEWFVQESKW